MSIPLCEKLVNHTNQNTTGCDATTNCFAEDRFEEESRVSCQFLKKGKDKGNWLLIEVKRVSEMA